VRKPPNDSASAAERLFELAAVFSDAVDGWLAERGLTRARAEVLWRLRHQGPMTQRDLSQALRCSPRNVTGLIDALEVAGLVTREAHPTDRRAILATLTAKGTATAGEMHTRQRQAGDALFADLGRSELASFTAALDRVLARMRELGTDREADQ
jgi:DNA-binding MarR family transcriptional regulator